MKRVPNILSAARIPLSLLLPFLAPLGVPFLIVYSVCGLTDMLDGFLARKLGATSALGSVLDSVGDCVFIAAAAFALYPTLRIAAGIWVWVAAITAVRLASVIVVRMKFRTFAMLHTWSNKATGFLLFCLPYFLPVAGVQVSGIVVCVAASLSALEELAIHIMSKELRRDVKWIFGCVR